ncbi:hypothetical protein GCM10010967_14950 [Dyadobacter beijingensis]|uniref:YceI-like domain-containing protein n=1 Tax=Dyadobacter beijingensis TaxID=365489 RepID=A0ABQ2HMW6_9BACT|nr:hypothetical protein [Dyadobacter beijingensis]GGM84146.1 hypothetical protein GCM10010967_14950 [Dyadobacter beijingensis]
MTTHTPNPRQCGLSLNIKGILHSLLIFGLMMLIGGCDSPLENDRIDEFALESGGYMRIVSPYPVTASSFSFSVGNMKGTKMECLHEAVTQNKGSLFESYRLVISFVDNTPDNGVNPVSGKAFRSIPASSYALDASTGYPRATMIITGQEALEAVGLDLTKIAAGDRFEITGTMILTDGKSFSAANTAIDITGGAFYSSPFFYRIAVKP